VRDRAPEIILASWCGKKVRKATIREREGWSMVPAVANGHIYEIKSTYILQPGPASLTEGVRQVHFQLCRALNVPVRPELRPAERTDDPA
jgi:iron complex transport system substrate-binding protein